MRKGMSKDQLYLVALDYLNKNPNRFNEKEKIMFMQNLRNWADENSNEVYDEVFDFLVDSGIYQGKSREETFLSYLNEKYGAIRFSRILDVGAGRMCKLSEALARYGNMLYAIDPQIRLSQEEAKQRGIKRISLKNFVCDEFAAGKKGTPIRDFDYIFGLEPCDATEHIIRQSLKYDKRFDVSLCGAPHKALNGKTFENYEAWYEYLASISKDVEICQVGSFYYATNSRTPDNEREF